MQEFMSHIAHRRVNSWLKDLEEKKCIVREYTPINGHVTKPAVCYLTTKGRKHIKDSFTYSSILDSLLFSLIKTTGKD